MLYYDDSLGSSSLFDRVVCEVVLPFLVVIFLAYMRVSLLAFFRIKFKVKWDDITM